MHAWMLFVFLIPLFVPLVMKRLTGRDFEWWEVALNMVASTLFAAVACYSGLYLLSHDTQVFNGEVVDKARVTVPCSHSYSCNCHEVCSGSGSSRSCSTECDTCYEHSHDYDWSVYSNMSIDRHVVYTDIDRVDRQGVIEPPRYTLVQKGEPFSATGIFTNYVKAASSSILRDMADDQIREKYAKKTQGVSYPDDVFDYYKIKRVLVLGPSLSDFASARNEMSSELSEGLKTLGPAKKANLVFVFSDDPSADFGRALAAKWLGGKQNDTLVFIGLGSTGTDAEGPRPINWVFVTGWSKDSLYRIKIRDDILDMKSLSPKDFPKLYQAVALRVTQGFHYRDMKQDFAYLSYEIDPGPTYVVGLLLINILFSFVLSVFFARTPAG